MLFSVTLIPLLSMKYTCSACKREWDTQHSLTQHRKSCRIFKARTQKLCQASKEAFEERKREKRKSMERVKVKLPRVEHLEPQDIRRILRGEANRVSNHIYLVTTTINMHAHNRMSSSCTRSPILRYLVPQIYLSLLHPILTGSKTSYLVLQSPSLVLDEFCLPHARGVFVGLPERLMT